MDNSRIREKEMECNKLGFTLKLDFFFLLGSEIIKFTG